MSDQRIIIELPHGWLGTFDQNEIEHVSTIPDPPKYRFAVNEGDLDEGNLGMLSFNTRRQDGELDEWATIGVRLITHHGTRAAVVTLSVRDASTPDVRECFLVSPYGVACNVPITAPNLGGSAGSEQLRSTDGRFWTVMQNDGNLVIYQNATPFVYTADTPIWSSGTGGR